MSMYIQQRQHSYFVYLHIFYCPIDQIQFISICVFAPYICFQYQCIQFNDKYVAIKICVIELHYVSMINICQCTYLLSLIWPILYLLHYVYSLIVSCSMYYIDLRMQLVIKE